MIVGKNMRVNLLGEPLFEKVDLVLRPGERVGLMGSEESTVTTFLQVLAGVEELDEGIVTTDGEKVFYVSVELLQNDSEVIAQLRAEKPTYVLLDARNTAHSPELQNYVAGFRGGILIASSDEKLMQAAKITRVVELQPATKNLTTFTGNYAAYLVEREKNETRIAEAYKKQQKEKKRIEEWLEQKQKEAAIDRSPQKGATIRTKKKYLEREILSKQIPKPATLDEE